MKTLPCLIICIAISSCGVVSGFGSANEISKATVVAKKQMEVALLDAETARYKDVHAFRNDFQGKSEYVFCGAVNSKNGFGAYTGYRRFIATPEGVQLEEESSIFKTSEEIFCPSDKDAGVVSSW